MLRSVIWPSIIVHVIGAVCSTISSWTISSVAARRWERDRSALPRCARDNLPELSSLRRKARAGLTVTMRRICSGCCPAHCVWPCSSRISEKRLSESVLARLSVPTQRFTPSSCSRRRGKGGWLK